ncbi:DNA/RNA polymerases superfamily protein [Cucumis melo var. makuwa]|uniref:DNA/RNA polymerases superfamily protein n=1 Tax=Cucumis melo var. makuwa TaxID=1194695 RepID=A0A5D3E6W7_CUCMM|nr:DNA/RNA polymerases superfamily protein [Cucumis melo var. makuwa]
MAHLKKKRFLAGTYGKLKDRQIDPCRIIAKYEPNAYKLALPEGINISPVFNIADLKKYNVPDGFQLT